MKVAVEGEVPAEGEGVEKGSQEDVAEEGVAEETRTERIKRSGMQRMENIKKAFSKENMEKTKLKTKENLEKTRQRTKENLEKTRQRTRDNIDKTRHNMETKMAKLGTERKEKLRVSRDKLKKSLKTRPKNATYRVPPFTFHVKKIREGQMVGEVDHDLEVEEVLEVEKEKTKKKPSMKNVVVGGLEEVEIGLDDHDLEVGAEEGVLVNLDSPEMEAVLEVVDSSKLVLVEEDVEVNVPIIKCKK